MTSVSIALFVCVLILWVAMVMMTKTEIPPSSFDLSSTKANMSVAERDCLTRNGSMVHLTNLSRSSLQTAFLEVTNRFGKAVWLGYNDTEIQGNCNVLYPKTPGAARIKTSSCDELHHYICFQSTVDSGSDMTTSATSPANFSSSTSGQDSLTPTHVIVIIYVACVVVVIVVGVAVVKLRKRPQTSMLVPYPPPPPSLPLIYGVQHSRIRPPFNRRLTPQVRKLSEVDEGAENNQGTLLLYNGTPSHPDMGDIDDVVYEQYSFSSDRRQNDCPMTPESETYTPLLNPPTTDGDVTSTIIFFGPSTNVTTGSMSLNTGDSVLENPVYESYVGSTYL
ncbi:uncharacterized protein LOC124129751 isoform X2 [Haliotis rufescens]|uniref:uncharacterized protein LOC124129751 isoform X2 n=1 Tax=Haliotis rufescens TaxID=6454 RepID=UPI00201E7927|nr:uncharacterized protein LOC124129751 isoform X2 [Haliotis rufescens]